MREPVPIRPYWSRIVWVENDDDEQFPAQGIVQIIDKETDIPVLTVQKPIQSGISRFAVLIETLPANGRARAIVEGFAYVTVQLVIGETLSAGDCLRCTQAMTYARKLYKGPLMVEAVISQSDLVATALCKLTRQRADHVTVQTDDGADMAVAMTIKLGAGLSLVQTKFGSTTVS